MPDVGSGGTERHLAVIGWKADGSRTGPSFASPMLSPSTRCGGLELCPRYEHRPSSCVSPMFRWLTQVYLLSRPEDRTYI